MAKSYTRNPAINWSGLIFAILIETKQSLTALSKELDIDYMVMLRLRNQDVNEMGFTNGLMLIQHAKELKINVNKFRGAL